MTRFAVLLRGVNVGGHNRIPMPAFRSLLDGLGCTEVKTHLQSGNAVVSWSGSAAALGKAVEQALREDADLPVSVLVRATAELDAVVGGNPFADEHLDPTMLHVVFLGGPPPEIDVEALLPDRVVVGEREVYVAYAVNSQQSKAAKLLQGKRFPVVATARNWRTVLALQELVRG